MDMLITAVDALLHFDKYLSVLIQEYGTLTYGILFLIVFAETGLVITPFLPGDSLLFVAGAFAALGALDLKLLLIVLSVAAILGDSVNYEIGKLIGRRIYEGERIRFIKKEHLLKTRDFYEKYGMLTIIIARFAPVVRTFAPFVAGVGEMHYMKFVSFNIIGGLLWVCSFTIVGYYFGNLPVVKDNFTFVIIAIVLISVMPVLIGLSKQKTKVKE